MAGLLHLLAILLVGMCLGQELRGAREATLPPVVPLPAGATEVPLAELEALLRERPNITVLDVRTASEVKSQGWLRGAKNLDIFQATFLDNFKALRYPPNEPIIIYCALGGRARQAAGMIAPLGYRHIFLPDGGYNAWRKAGKPTEGGAAPK